MSALRFELVEGHGVGASATRESMTARRCPSTSHAPSCVRSARFGFTTTNRSCCNEKRVPSTYRRAASYVDRLFKGEKPADRRRLIQTGHQPQNREGTEPHCAALATRRLVRFRRQVFIHSTGRRPHKQTPFDPPGSGPAATLVRSRLPLGHRSREPERQCMRRDSNKRFQTQLEGARSGPRMLSNSRRDTLDGRLAGLNNLYRRHLFWSHSEC